MLLEQINRRLSKVKVTTIKTHPITRPAKIVSGKATPKLIKRVDVHASPELSIRMQNYLTVNKDNKNTPKSLRSLALHCIDVALTQFEASVANNVGYQTAAALKAQLTSMGISEVFIGLGNAELIVYYPKGTTIARDTIPSTFKGYFVRTQEIKTPVIATAVV